MSVTSATFSTRRQAGDQVVELEHEADVAAAVRGERRFVGARQIGVAVQHLAARRHVEAAEDVEQRRLAGARRPQQHDELSFVERQADLAQRVHVDLAHAIDLGELANIEERRRHRLGALLPLGEILRLAHAHRAT